MPRPPSAASLARALARASLKPRRRYRRRAAAGGVVSGRGFYRGFGRQVGTLVGGAAGGALAYRSMPTPGAALAGGKLGGYMGGHVGDMTEKLAMRAVGRGRYTINYNSIIGNVPSIRNSKGREGATIVRHKEYIGDVVSSRGFNPQYVLPINAAQSATFPWLSQIAANYEQYEIQGMLFEFVSSSGDTTSGSTALGEVVMSTQYNSVEPPFTNKQQMLNQEFAVSAKPSVNSIHPIECAPKQTTLELLYCRVGAPAANTDIRLYDLANFTLATVGQQDDGNNIGELYVTYEICLLKPKLAVGSSLSTSSFSHWNLNNSTLRISSPFVNPTEFQNDFNITLVQGSGQNGQLIFPVGTQGTFKIDCYWNTLSTNQKGQYRVVSVSAGGLIGPNLFNNHTTFDWESPIEGVLGNWAYSAIISMNAPTTDVVTVQFTGVAQSGASLWNTGDVMVTKLSGTDV